MLTFCCVVAAIIFIPYVIYRTLKRKSLMKKYNDKVIVDMIMDETKWQGQTKEQLLDSIGRPLDIDRKVYKTKSKEVWKYDRVGKNRYRERYTFENGKLVGWNVQ